jgi:hypothetical protein
MILIDISKITEKLGMSPDSTIEQVCSFIENLLTENNTLQCKVDSIKSEKAYLSKQAQHSRKHEINRLLDACVISGKISVYTRSIYQNLAEKDFDTTKAILNGMLPYDHVVNQERKDWTLTDWQVKDGEGLQNLKDNYSNAYRELYFKTIGKEPKY